jgi:hypothetical protein
MDLCTRVFCVCHLVEREHRLNKPSCCCYDHDQLNPCLPIQHKNPYSGNKLGTLNCPRIATIFITNQLNTRVISSFRREVDKNCSHLGYYAALSGNSIPTFRDKLSVPSSRVKNTFHGYFST